jgi:hypothetical protein
MHYGLKSDIELRPKGANNGLMQAQQTASLFDHLVRTQEQRRWHLKSECLRSFHINDELEFGRLTKGHVSRIVDRILRWGL